MNSKNMRTFENSKDILKRLDAEWADGNWPRIEGIIHQTPENIGNRILSRLVRNKMNYCREKDQNLSLKQWQNRFPD